MKNNAMQGAQLAKRPIAKMFAIQSVVLLLGSAGIYFVDVTKAYSALAGGLVFLVPNSYFARWAFRFSGAQAANEVARSFYRGEAGKFLLTVLLFAGIFTQIQPLDAVTVFLSYIVMMIVNWLLALYFIR